MDLQTGCEIRLRLRSFVSLPFGGRETPTCRWCEDRNLQLHELIVLFGTIAPVVSFSWRPIIVCACTCTPYQHCCCGGEVVRHGLGAIYEHVLPGLNQDTQWQTPGKISCRLLSRAFWCFHSEEIVRCRFWKTFEHSVSTELAHDVQCMQTIVCEYFAFCFRRSATA